MLQWTRTVLSAVAALAMVVGIASCTSSGTSSVTTASTSSAQQKVTMPLFGAGTLAVPFKTVFQEFEKKYPNVNIQGQFGGSVKMVKQVTELGQVADVVATADYSVIPKYMFGDGGKKQYANWYAGFVSNAITFVYTDKSKYAKEINSTNWYEYLSKPGVQIGRSNPDTDPSGYQTLQMLELAEKYYKKPGLAKEILANAPQSNIRDTETELIGALEAGQIDYLAIYRSDALQHGFKSLDLPADINLSDPQKAASYKTASVTTKNGTLEGKPIIYAITIPTNANHPDWAEKYVEFLLGPEGQSIMKSKGFGIVSPALASDISKVPATLKSLMSPWPGN